MAVFSPRVFVAIPAILVLAACDKEPQAPQQRFEPVVVYAAYEDENYLQALFADFTAETRIPVTVRHGDAEQLVDDVIANRGSPPADVLLTTNVADAWRAADEGALRPIAAANMTDVAEFLRDPDNQWTAARMSVTVIAVGSGAAEEPPTTYVDLGKPVYGGGLCLSSSSLPVNRALIAMLISELGPKPAERLVRGWVRNLAVPVFETEKALLDSLDAGTCRYAIVSSPLVAGEWILPDPAYVDIEGIGIARHARYPESAEKLVNWLLSADVQIRHASSTRTHPAVANLPDSPLEEKISKKNVGIAGWQDTDAALLAERAGYR